MDLLFLLWFFVLPILGILCPIFAVLFWFFIVPPVAKMFTYNRFKPVSIHAIHDAAGFVELAPTKERLPENVERTKKQWHFLPRPSWKEKGKGSKEVLEAEKIATQKYILKGFGKPFWIDYAGKIVSMNAGALASTQQSNDNPHGYLEQVVAYIKTLPKQVIAPNTGKKFHLRKYLTQIVDDLKKRVDSKPLTLIDPSYITQAVEELYPPSVIDAIAENRLTRGRKSKGKELTPLILGGAIIIGLVVIGVALILVLGG